MKYENITMNEGNRIKGADRLILLTLEKGLKLKAQGEALCELVAEKAAAIIQSKGTIAESGAKSTRKLVWISKGGAEYPITCTTTTKAGSVNWKETAKLYEDLLTAHGIEVPAPRYNASTTSTTYGFDGHEHKKAFEKKAFGDDLATIAEKLGITTAEE